MPKLIFVNLPVADLPRAKAFYESIGATNNPQFTDENAACMVMSETIHVMLHSHQSYKRFTSKEIADTHKTSAVLLAVSEDSREAVDTIADKAVAAGAKEPREKQDYGWMYYRAFDDLDGHTWEVTWMDAEAAKKAMADEKAA